MQFGDIRGTLDTMIGLLKRIAAHTNQSGCCTAVTTAGVGDVPAGLASVAITQTSAGYVDIVLSDGSTFQMSTSGEVFVDAAGANKSLPAYTISGSASWKWHGIK